MLVHSFMRLIQSENLIVHRIKVRRIRREVFNVPILRLLYTFQKVGPS